MTYKPYKTDIEVLKITNLIYELLSRNSKIFFLHSLESFSDFIRGIYIHSIDLRCSDVTDFVDGLYNYGASVINKKLNNGDASKHVFGDIVYTDYIALNQRDLDEEFSFHNVIYENYLETLHINVSNRFDMSAKIGNFFANLKPLENQCSSVNHFLNNQLSYYFDCNIGTPRMILQIDGLIWFYFGHFVVARIIEEESDYFCWLPGFYLWAAEKYLGEEFDANTFTFPSLIKGYRAAYGEEIKCVEAFYRDLFSYKEYLSSKV